MVPLAPATFSTTTDWPHSAASLSASVRVSLSALPPGATGTMMRTGLFGKLSAEARAAGACRARAESRGSSSARSADGVRIMGVPECRESMPAVWEAAGTA